MTDSLALPVLDEELAARLRARMAEVEVALAGHAVSEAPFVTDAARRLMEAGGKRVRPLLVLLAAETGPEPAGPTGAAAGDVLIAACVVELTHLASLYHDDVMDEAQVRRGVPSVNATYDNSTAILMGDLLFGKASELVAGLGAQAVLIQAQTFVRLCAGQIRDARPCPEGSDPVEYYLGVLGDKTGALIGTAARYGAMFSGGSAAHVETMTAYGERLGVAFQLADDLIDITSEAAEMGKTPGTDLREGVDTLGVLYARQSADPADARLLELLGRDLHDERLHDEALGLLRANAALERVRATTQAVGKEATEVLAPLPESDAKTALVALVTSVVDRVG